MTTETMLMEQALDRDAARWIRATDDHERLWIMDRMIDTMTDFDPELDQHDARARVVDLLRAASI